MINERKYKDKQGHETVPTGQRKYSRTNNQFIRFKRLHFIGYFVTALEKYQMELRQSEGRLTKYDALFVQMIMGWQSRGNRSQATIAEVRTLLDSREVVGRFLARVDYADHERSRVELHEDEFDKLLRYVDQQVEEWQTYIQGMDIETDSAIRGMDAYETMVYGLLDSYNRPNKVNLEYENYRVTNDFIVVMHVLYHFIRYFETDGEYTWRDIRWYKDYKTKFLHSYAIVDEIKISSERLAEWLGYKNDLAKKFKDAFDK